MKFAHVKERCRIFLNEENGFVMVGMAAGGGSFIWHPRRHDNHHRKKLPSWSQRKSNHHRHRTFFLCSKGGITLIPFLLCFVPLLRRRFPPNENITAFVSSVCFVTRGVLSGRCIVTIVARWGITLWYQSCNVTRRHDRSTPAPRVGLVPTRSKRRDLYLEAHI